MYKCYNVTMIKIKSLRFDIDNELFKRFKVYCIQNGKTMRGVVVSLIRNFMKGKKL